MQGTGRLYLMIPIGIPNDLIPDPTFGCIVSDELNPSTKRPYAITIVGEDKKLLSQGVNLKSAHYGTPVRYDAKKIPGHEVYHCVDVSLVSTASSTVAPKSVGQIAYSREGLLTLRVKNNGTCFGWIEETKPGTEKHSIDPDDLEIIWDPPSLSQRKHTETKVRFEMDDETDTVAGIQEIQ